MTMVRTRLLLDRMKNGETAELLLKGEEPLRNVPRAVEELGDEIVSCVPAEEPGVHRLILRRRRR